MIEMSKYPSSKILYIKTHTKKEVDKEQETIELQTSQTQLTKWQ